MNPNQDPHPTKVQCASCRNVYERAAGKCPLCEDVNFKSWYDPHETPLNLDIIVDKKALCEHWNIKSECRECKLETELLAARSTVELMKIEVAKLREENAELRRDRDDTPTAP